MTPLELRTAEQSRKDAILLNLLENSNNVRIRTLVAKLGGGGGSGGGVKPTDLYSLQKTVSYNDAAWAKAVKLMYVWTSAPFMGAKSTTGYVRGVRWDGTLAAKSGTGVASAFIDVSFGTAPVSPYNTPTPKFCAVVPCDVNGNVSGDLTYFECPSSRLSALDVSGLTALAYLDCSGNWLTSLDVSGLSALTYLRCSTNQLTSLTVSGLSVLNELVCSTNKLQFLDISNMPNLGICRVDRNMLSSAVVDTIYNTLNPSVPLPMPAGSRAVSTTLQTPLALPTDASAVARAALAAGDYTITT